MNVDCPGGRVERRRKVRIESFVVADPRSKGGDPSHVSAYRSENIGHQLSIVDRHFQAVARQIDPPKAAEDGFAGRLTGLVKKARMI